MSAPSRARWRATDLPGEHGTEAPTVPRPAARIDRDGATGVDGEASSTRWRRVTGDDSSTRAR